MKILYVACNVVARSEIEQILEKIGNVRYDLIPQVLFYSAKLNPRLDTSIWPGYNVSFLIFEADDEKIRQLIQEISSYNQQCAFEEEKVEVYEIDAKEVVST
ncbi:MAG: hypothetical protein N2Z72_07210 [Bacteroidales bacterium]|nr:hypothetical protein [Bacteroidales bacterium]